MYKRICSNILNHKKSIRTFILFFAYMISLSSCSKEEEIINLTIASTIIERDGYKCFIVKFEGQDTWSIFYDTIDGFYHIEGREYVINITKTKISNPPQDASSYHYKLNYIISEIEKESEGIPSSYWN